MDREVKRLKQSRIPIIKVRWNSRIGPEFTWEHEDQFKKNYLHAVYSDSEPWIFQWVSDDEPKALEEASQFLEQAPPSPNYVSGPEHPPSPDYVPDLEYPEYLVPSDDEVPIEDQPLPADASPTALSPSYVADSGPSEEDPEEDPADGGDDDDDDNDDDDDARDTEVFETDESAPTPLSPPTHTSPTYDEAPLGCRAAMIRSRAASPPPVPSPRLRRARISVRPQTPITAATEALIVVIPSPPLPLPSPPLPLPAPSSPLLLPTTNHREDVPEANVPPRKRLCLTAPTSRFEVGESSVAGATRQPRLDVTHSTDYNFVDNVDATLGRPMSREVTCGITDVLDDMSSVAGATRQPRLDVTHSTDYNFVDNVDATLGRPMSREVTCGITDVLDDMMYVRFEDAQDDRALLRARVNMLFRDRRYHLHTAMLLESKARHARQAWSQDMKCNRAVHDELLTYRAENSHIKTIGHDAAYGMPWKTLKKMMTEKYYCPKEQNKKLEIELINGVQNMSGGLLDHGISGKSENKKKLDDNSRNNQNQQQSFKKQNVARAYTTGPGEKKVYGESKPLCPKCNYQNHDGTCAPKCNNCKNSLPSGRD
ncbi:hypothetical protein Tco_0287553 [Tanacetum coccineum]